MKDKLMKFAIKMQVLLDEDGQESALRAGVAEPVSNGGGDFVEPLAVGGRLQPVGVHLHVSRSRGGCGRC